MNAILEILEEQTRSWSDTQCLCPPPAAFFGQAIGLPDSHWKLRVFARHLLVCSRCATYWQAIQDDSCLTLGELYGLFNAKPGQGQDYDFASLRAEHHLSWCSQCRGRRDLASGIRRMFSFNPSPWYVNLGKALALENLEPVFRSCETEKPAELDGWVMGLDGIPCLTAGRLLRLPVNLRHAVFRDSGVIEIGLQVTPNVQRVLCAITVEGQPLLLPECHPQNGFVTFSVDTTVQKKDGKDWRIPSSALTVWLFMSDLVN